MQTVSEWKEALANAGSRPVCALFTSAQDVRCRVLTPAFSRLSAVPEGAEGGSEGGEKSGEKGGDGDGAFPGVDFLLCVHDASKDDGLAQQVNTFHHLPPSCLAFHHPPPPFHAVAPPCTPQVFDEAYVGIKEVPTFLFIGECLEHKKWRYVATPHTADAVTPHSALCTLLSALCNLHTAHCNLQSALFALAPCALHSLPAVRCACCRYMGNDVPEVKKRLRRIVDNERLDDGPDAAEAEAE